MALSRFSNPIRSFVTSAIRRSGHSEGGIPGENLPFNIDNKFTLTALYIVFFGSGLGAPFFVLRHQLLKK